MLQCAGRGWLFLQSQLDRPQKTNALLAHLLLAWRGSDAPVSTNRATIERGFSTMSMDSRHYQTFHHYNRFPLIHGIGQFPMCVTVFQYVNLHVNTYIYIWVCSILPAGRGKKIRQLTHGTNSDTATRQSAGSVSAKSRRLSRALCSFLLRMISREENLFYLFFFDSFLAGVTVHPESRPSR